MRKKVQKIIIVGASGLILGSLLALLLPTKEIIIKKTLPAKIISEKTLQQLSANVAGEIVAKSSESFVLKTNSGNITIYYDPQGLSSFMRLDTIQEVSFTDLKIGDKATGGVSIIISEENKVGKLGNRQIGDVIAHNFNIH